MGLRHSNEKEMTCIGFWGNFGDFKDGCILYILLNSKNITHYEVIF